MSRARKIQTEPSTCTRSRGNEDVTPESRAPGNRVREDTVTTERLMTM
jgi:hypothetical protein